MRHPRVWTKVVTAQKATCGTSNYLLLRQFSADFAVLAELREKRPVAKGKEKHQARLQAIQLLGKDLARRARRKCELCETAGELRTHDLAPDDEPALGSVVLLCERCRELAAGQAQDARTLRFLEGAVWNEEPAVAGLARTLLGDVDADWARDTLEMLPS